AVLGGAAVADVGRPAARARDDLQPGLEGGVHTHDMTAHGSTRTCVPGGTLTAVDTAADIQWKSDDQSLSTGWSTGWPGLSARRSSTSAPREPMHQKVAF